MKNYYVYIITNMTNGTLYIGVTNNLERRMWEHKNKHTAGFSAKYGLSKLVYFEQFCDVKDALSAEKKLKGLLRKKKIALIVENNPLWNDLSVDSSLCSE